MMPPKTHPKWKQLVQGQVPIQIQFLAFNALTKTLSVRCKLDASPANIDACVDRLYEFAQKYESTLANDFKKIFG